MSEKWYVGAILKEPVSVSLRFAAWYLEQGAEKILLYFDDPQDPAADVLEGHPRVDVTRCAADTWNNEIGIPSGRPFVRRQNKAVTHAYHSLTDGWFLNVDSDEFLYCGDRTIGEFLSETPPEVWTVLIRPAEVIQTDLNDPGDHFRCPMDKTQMREVYQNQAYYFAQRSGLVGHHAGKSATRLGVPGVYLRQHWPVLDQPPGGAAEFTANDGVFLLHYFDRGYESWKAKAGWRAAARGFRNRIKYEIQLAEQSDNPDEALRTLYQSLHHFDEARLERLKEQGRHLYLDLDLDRLVEKHFPGAAPSSN